MFKTKVRLKKILTLALTILSAFTALSVEPQQAFSAEESIIQSHIIETDDSSEFDLMELHLNLPPKEAPSFDGLPSELKFLIIKYLDIRSLSHIERLSRKFRTIGFESLTWKDICISLQMDRFDSLPTLKKQKLAVTAKQLKEQLQNIRTGEKHQTNWKFLVKASIEPHFQIVPPAPRAQVLITNQSFLTSQTRMLIAGISLGGLCLDSATMNRQDALRYIGMVLSFANIVTVADAVYMLKPMPGSLYRFSRNWIARLAIKSGNILMSLSIIQEALSMQRPQISEEVFRLADFTALAPTTIQELISEVSEVAEYARERIFSRSTALQLHFQSVLDSAEALQEKLQIAVNQGNLPSEELLSEVYQILHFVDMKG